MRRQEFFNGVVKHLRKQKKPAQKPNGYCFYRVPHTKLKCAIGAMIPDDKYDEGMEGLGVTSLMDDYPSTVPIRNTEDNRQFCLELQEIHDFTSALKWEERFQEFAKKWNLRYTAP